ncbi:unnamed protein product [Chondrus crispus]|uniref:Uncharacterized protein n=1 Tax=Chondrus crispus TaxID=2769 RepID=R7Q609_CHOCR|nr:unnamed protein product [Chondrus crispus]CDF33952.1 unnamed protein product [Chondrus crispus]|eukprot:XP_005713771.1 unnamed protein product [Chondrus crispus]
MRKKGSGHGRRDSVDLSDLIVRGDGDWGGTWKGCDGCGESGCGSRCYRRRRRTRGIRVDHCARSCVRRSSSGGGRPLGTRGVSGGFRLLLDALGLGPRAREAESFAYRGAFARLAEW